MKEIRAQKAEVVRQYGPFPGVEQVHGVTFDGEHVWFAHDGGLVAFDLEGKEVARHALDADAGTAFDGTHLWQIAGREIHRIDRKSGEVVASIPSPSSQSSGLAYADGALWVGQYRDRKIIKIDAQTGKILKTIESDRFVTGVTFAGDELWHGASGDGPPELRRLDVETGAVVETLEMPEDSNVAGIEAGDDVIYVGSSRSKSAVVRAVRRPRRARV
jgi:outer membrane protein assembly factor BamB